MIRVVTMLKCTGVLLVCVLASGTGHAETFAVPGLYSVTVTDWLHQTTPGGDVFTCIKCKDQVQISIEAGPSFENRADETKILALFKDQRHWEAFAKALIQDVVPIPTDQYEIEVYQTGLVAYQGKQMLQLACQVRIGSSISYDTSLLTVHHHRIIKVTTNYYDGAMTPDVRQYISSFLDSIRFID
jgi:hypothetical protein